MPGRDARIGRQRIDGRGGRSTHSAQIVNVSSVVADDVDSGDGSPDGLAVLRASTGLNKPWDGYGDVRDEHFVGSFRVDTTFRNLIFAKGHAPGARNSLGDTEPAVLNGTWTDGGTMFTDDHGDTTSFSCAGKVGTSVPTVSAVLAVKTTASTLNFKLEVPADELTREGDCAGTNCTGTSTSAIRRARSALPGTAW